MEWNYVLVIIATHTKIEGKWLNIVKKCQKCLKNEQKWLKSAKNVEKCSFVG